MDSLLLQVPHLHIQTTMYLVVVFIEKKNMHISGPRQFKALLFKGQLYITLYEIIRLLIASQPHQHLTLTHILILVLIVGIKWFNL